MLRSVDEVLIRENAQNEVVLVGVTEAECATAEDLLHLLERGTLARTTAATRMNAVSSRSHAVFSVVLEQRRPKRAQPPPSEQDVEPAEHPAPAPRPRAERIRAKLQLVDLAGSERNKRTQTSGQHFKESVNINQGLLALANVINVLSDMSCSGEVAHVPYRDHKLTRLLRNSLGGNAATYMVACISTGADDFQETLNTLRYAARARNIKNTLVVNTEEEGQGDGASGKELARLEREMEALRAELAGQQQGGGGGGGSGGSAELTAQLAAETVRSAELAAEVAILQTALQEVGGGGGGGGSSGCDGRCEERLASAQAELEEARLGLRKDEEMFAALSVEIEDLAVTNSQLREELDQLKDAELQTSSGGGGGTGGDRGQSAALRELEAAEAVAAREEEAEEDDEVRYGDELGAAALRSEQARLKDGVRRVKRAERDSTEAAGKFIIQRNLVNSSWVVGPHASMF